MSKVIRINDKTYEELCNQGTLADTFDSVLQKLLFKHNKNRGAA